MNNFTQEKREQINVVRMTAQSRVVSPPVAQWILAKLKSLLEDDDITAGELAGKIGVSGGHISQIMSGGRNIGKQFGYDFAEFLGIPYKEMERLANEQYKDAKPIEEKPPFSYALRATDLGAREGWRELRERAEARYGALLNEETMRAVERTSFGQMPEHMTIEDVKRIHDLLFDLFNRDPEAKTAAMQPPHGTKTSGKKAEK